ncbi:MAG: energy transducer TonB family protein [Burkholderiaceae bacterium]
MKDWLREPLGLALLASFLLHALMLTLRFAPPLPVILAPQDQGMEIVLLNTRSTSRPVKADVIAQVDQEGGGEHDRGRAKSPLPPSEQARDGTDLMVQRQRLEALEARQRELLALSRSRDGLAPVRPAPETPRPEASERETREAVLARMQAEIERNIEDYNKRPRRMTFGVNALGAVHAQYVADWASQIERIGTERYPPEARGKMYDSLIITVEIDRHGQVVDVIINRKSRHEALNRAVRQIVYAGQPYARFPPEMTRQGDILQIVRTWTFTHDGLETSTLRSDRSSDRP